MQVFCAGDELFVVVGGEEVHYGWDALHTGQPSFRQWVLSQENYDLSRFVFLGTVVPEAALVSAKKPCPRLR